MLRRVLIFLLIVFLIDLYVFQGIKLLIKDLTPSMSRLISGIYWFFTVFTFSVFIAGLITDWHTWPKAVRVYLFAAVMIILITKLFVVLFLLIDDLTRLVRWGFSGLYQRFYDSPQIVNPEEKIVVSRSQFLVRMAFVISSIPFISLLYGMGDGKYNYQVKRRKIKFPKLPSTFEGIRIVQISDIHTGSFFDTKHIEKAVSMINTLKGDVIFFTGDLVNDRSDEAVPFIDTLSKLNAKHGVFSILGNHDYGDYVQWPSREAKVKNLEQLKNIHKEMGWKLMLDEHAFISEGNDKLGLIGVQNWSTHMRFPKYGSLPKAVQGMEFAPVNILLTHDPSHWHGEVTENYPQIDLTLAGHTHGFQFGVEIPALKIKWSPVQYVYKEWADLYDDVNGQHLYVNRGLGFLGYPGRVGILPEITVIELSKG